MLLLAEEPKPFSAANRKYGALQGYLSISLLPEPTIMWFSVRPLFPWLLPSRGFLCCLQLFATWPHIFTPCCKGVSKTRAREFGGVWGGGAFRAAGQSLNTLGFRITTVSVAYSQRCESGNNVIKLVIELASFGVTLCKLLKAGLSQFVLGKLRSHFWSPTLICHDNGEDFVTNRPAEVVNSNWD